MKKDIHISFDLDGTLIDSMELMKDSWEYMALKLGVSVRFSEYKQYIGMPFHNILSNLNLESESKDIYKYYFDYGRKNASQVKLVDGANFLINYLNDNDIGWSIITSKPRVNAIEILNSIGLEAKFLICPEDVKQGKPAKDSMLKLRRIAKINSKTKVFYVGDMLSDLKFSIESGVDYIHYSKGIEGSIDQLVMNKFHSIDDLTLIRLILK